MNMSGDSEIEVSTLVKVIVGWVLSGLIGCVLFGYPTYDKEGTVDALLPLVTLLGPTALVLGVIHIGSEGYTTIQIKEKK